MRTDIGARQSGQAHSSVSPCSQISPAARDVEPPSASDGVGGIGDGGGRTGLVAPAGAAPFPSPMGNRSYRESCGAEAAMRAM